MSGPDRPRPKGLRRVERWGVGVVMGIMAFVLEKIVLRSIRRNGGEPEASNGPGAKVTTQGGEVNVEER